MRKILLTLTAIIPLVSFAQRKKHKSRFIENIVITDERAGGTDAGTVLIRDVVVEKPVRQKHARPSGENTENSRIEEMSALQFKYALLTNREVESLQDDLLYDFIDDWWRTPYRMGGTSKRGVDCSGFTRELMRDVYEVSVPRTAREQFEGTDRVSRDELIEGDLVFFYTGGPYISHVGVYLGNNFFVHSSTRNGVTISSLDEEYYHRHYRGAGRNPSRRESSVASAR